MGGRLRTDLNFSPNGKLITFVWIKTDERQQALLAHETAPACAS